MLVEWMMNGHAILYTGVTVAFWTTILIVGKRPPGLGSYTRVRTPKCALDREFASILLR